VVEAGRTNDVAAVLREQGETVTVIGRIVPRRGEGVVYQGSIAF